MSSYTLQLREYIEQVTQDINSLSISDRIEAGRKQLFDFDYPVIDETHKKDFETKFIRKFYMREIGYETEGLFKFNLETWLTLNMPYWNKMIESEITYDGVNPLKNSLMDVTHNKKNDGSQTNSTDSNFQHDSNTGNDTTVNQSGNSFNRDLSSSNPDSRLQITTDNGNGTSTIEYASTIDENSANETSTQSSHSGGNNSATETKNQSSNSSMNENEDFSQHREGKIGVQTYAKMIQEHRQSLLRIENDIFKEMSRDLFMLVY
jgi:hypothetical protein